MSQNANSPAFPCSWMDFQPSTGVQVVREQYPGLTKREEFAKAAMAAIIATPAPLRDTRSGEVFTVVTPALCAESAVRYADALLAELEKKQ